MRTILYVLLLASYASPTYSQSPDSVKIFITSDQEARVFKERRELYRLQLGYKIIEAENSGLKHIIASMQQSLDSMNSIMEIMSAALETEREENTRLAGQVEHGQLRVKSYQDLAYKKTIEAQQAKKWRGKYHTMASLKIGEMIIVNAIFTFAIIYFTNNL